MKKILLLFALAGALMTGCAQSPSTVTTFILIRHAEKADDGTKDPDLSEEGKSRAAVLTQLLRETKVDAIYSTPFKRTQQTVQPLAMAKQLTVGTYNPMKGEDMDKLLAAHRGQTVLLSGHSNTTPWVANYFLGSNVYPDFTDADYDNLLVLSVIEKGNATVTWINFGKPTP